MIEREFINTALTVKKSLIHYERGDLTKSEQRTLLMLRNLYRRTLARLGLKPDQIRTEFGAKGTSC